MLYTLAATSSRKRVVIKTPRGRVLDKVMKKGFFPDDFYLMISTMRVLEPV